MTRKVKLSLGIGLLITLAAVWIVYWLRPSSSQSTVLAPSAASAAPQFVREGELFFIDGEQQDTLKRISIEIADNPQEIERGLMYRPYMPDSVGMLFVFDEVDVRSFWMKNTKIPLDILFVGEDKRIVRIGRDAMPYVIDAVESGKPAQYVVEVNAGFSSKYDIQEGDRIVFRRE